MWFRPLFCFQDCNEPVSGYDLHYLELPVLMGMPLSKGFKLNFGPSISYLLDLNIISPLPSAVYEEIKVTRFDYGLNLDLSYRIESFEIGARYNHGFKTVVIENLDPEFYGVFNLGKNRSFYLSFSYLIFE